MAAPLGRLGYLYVGTADFKRDLEYYTQVLGATVLWNYNEFGANVAGLGLPEGPQYLLADIRSAPSLLPLFDVNDPKAAANDVRASASIPERRSVTIPTGPCGSFKSPSVL